MHAVYSVLPQVRRRSAAVLPTLSLVFLLYPPPIAKAFLYFYPLLASTGLLVVLAAYLSLPLVGEKQADVLPVETPSHDHCAESTGHVIIGVCGEAAEVPCFVALEVREGDDDACDVDEGINHLSSLLGEESVVEGHVCNCDEVNDASSSEADGLAQGLWDCYLGMYSTWYHYCDD